MTNKRAVFAVAAVALLALAGCGSMGDILGNNPSSNRTYNNQVRGTVDYVDLNNHSIVLTNVSGLDSMLSSSGNGNSVRIYYDNNTNVQWNGASYRPEDLDRGDQVDVRVTQSGNRLMADTMTVTYNSSTASSSYPSSNYPNSSTYSTLRGTVRYVDTSSRTIQLEQTNWISGFNTNTNYSTLTVSFDPNTSVSVNGQLYPVSNLERGDVVDVQVQNLGSSNVYARSITLVRDVRR